MTGKADTYCGSKEPFKWVSHGNKVVVEFHTDSSTVSKGFKAHYDAVESQKASPVTEQATSGIYRNKKVAMDS